jgi:hypothetical protein
MESDIGSGWRAGLATGASFSNVDVDDRYSSVDVETYHDWQASIKNASELDFQSKELAPGNGIIFSGSSQWHYRDALPAKDHKSFCNLLFFHYIPRGASEIVDPRNWARLFGIPELADIPGINESS